MSKRIKTKRKSKLTHKQRLIKQYWKNEKKNNSAAYKERNKRRVNNTVDDRIKRNKELRDSDWNQLIEVDRSKFVKLKQATDPKIFEAMEAIRTIDNASVFASGNEELQALIDGDSLARLRMLNSLGDNELDIIINNASEYTENNDILKGFVG